MEVLTLAIFRHEERPPMPSSPIAAARSQYLLDLLAQVPDPRNKRGRRHALAGLLAAGIAAVIAGSRSFAAIGRSGPPMPARRRSSADTRGSKTACTAARSAPPADRAHHGQPPQPGHHHSGAGRGKEHRGSASPSCPTAQPTPPGDHELLSDLSGALRPRASR
jgi:hypothetical protein